MTVFDNTINERTVKATFTEHDICALLQKYLSENTGFVIDPRETMIKLSFDQKDCGTQGFKTEVTITMRNKL